MFRHLRRAALVFVVASLSASAATATGACRTETVTYTEQVPYIATELTPIYDWRDVIVGTRQSYDKTGTRQVWGKTGTETVWGKTGETTTVTTTVKDYGWVDNFIEHWNRYYRLDRYGNRTSYTLGSDGYGNFAPRYCSGKWKRVSGTNTWLWPGEPSCPDAAGNTHSYFYYKGYTYEYSDHWSTAAGTYNTWEVIGTRTVKSTVDVYGWVTQDTYGWVTQDIYDWVTHIVYEKQLVVVDYTATLVTKTMSVTRTADRDVCVRPS